MHQLKTPFRESSYQVVDGIFFFSLLVPFYNIGEFDMLTTLASHIQQDKQQELLHAITNTNYVEAKEGVLKD